MAGEAVRLTLRERLSYGFGDLGYSLPYNMVSGFLLYYYTNVVKLPAASVGIIFLLARLMDVIVDMLVGIAVDKTRSRWGRTRPYFLFTALPYAAIYIAVFAMPALALNAQLIYAFLTFKVLGIIMSCGSIPYTALMPMMTEDTGERLKLGGMRSIGTSVSVVVGTAATMPLVGVLGYGNEQRGFLAVAILFGGLSFVAILALFRNCQERFEDKSSPKFAVFPAIGEMLRNRAWIVVFGFCLVYFVRFGAMMAITPYFAIEVLRRPWMISIMLPAVAGMLLLSSFFAPALLARTGIRTGSVSVLSIALILFAVLPLAESNIPLFITVYIGACLATSVTITAAFTMIAETVDYHEWVFGARREGLLSAGISLATKVGMAIGSAGIAFMLASVRYVPDAVTDAARNSIHWAYYAGTIALLAVQIAITLFWPMDGLHQRIRDDVAARNLAIA